MQQVTGIYPSNLGAPSNEISGKAIQARQREGDTGTFNYIEAFGRSIRRTGQIILDLIPHVYDTERSIQIVGEDGKVALQKINQATISQQDGITPITLNDVTVGAYHLIVEMGPSFSTKREEARDGMQALMQSLGPQAVPLVADIYARQQDWPLADKLAKRFEMLLPPPIRAQEAQDSGEPPPPMPGPPPPSPEQQMQMQQAQQEHALNTARLQIDGQKLQVEMAKINAELRKAELDHHAAMAGHQVAAAAAQPDPRVDELQQAVGQLRDMVMHIAQAVAGPPPPEFQQHMPNAPQPDQPPPGGFFNSAPVAQ
jgi:hypothetical protein